MSEATIDQLVLAGWTGRNPQAIEQHILELEAIGIPRPTSIPSFYSVSAQLLTITNVIKVDASQSSGEVEIVVLTLPDGLWIGVGSDHTDRALERQDILHSKQVCAKPMASKLWYFGDLTRHWDQLLLRSFLVKDGERHLYQEDSVASLQKPEYLIEAYADAGKSLSIGSALFCGTLPAKQHIVNSVGFEIQLLDPILNRSIEHRYHVTGNSISCESHW
ncbi:hypothetical protein BST81_10895 [Leptolyngbya sp. 'hensonii']|nr:hypothetical protein BST81_10895 [Leptolyngbya sp. 'hensonii']